MTRYLRLYAYFVRFSVSRAMEFRLDFFFRIVMDLLYYIVNILFYKIIFLHSESLAGWNIHQVMVFVSGYLIVDAIQMTLFSNNLWILSTFVNKGELDYYLVRPVSSLFFLSLRDFAANSFINFIMAFGIFCWALAEYPEPFSLWQIALYFLMICNGTIIHYTMAMMFALPVFWTQSNRGLHQIFWGLTNFMERPDGIFKGWLRTVLTTIMPFCLIASFPARLIIEPFSWSLFIHILVVTVVLFILLMWLWKKSLRAYSSASS